MSKPISNARQRQLILEYLREHHRLTTLEARNKLGIMSPAPRVFELRKAGENIVTHYEWQTDAAGGQRWAGVYVLMTGGKNER